MKSIVRCFALIGAIAAFAGCSAATDAGTPQEGDKADDQGADISSTQQAVTVGWTPWTSEEYPPIVCDSGSLFNAVQCSGSYCDNTSAYCQASGGSVGPSSWTSYFSEEGTNYRYCPAGYWVTGLACRGNYCDDISLQCTRIYSISEANCYWTGWVSEEGGGYLSFGSRYYARGAQCNGSNCDNKRFYVCQPG